MPLSSVRERFHCEQSDVPLLCVSGEPGIGKSALLALFAKKAKQVLIFSIAKQSTHKTCTKRTVTPLDWCVFAQQSLQMLLHSVSHLVSMCLYGTRLIDHGRLFQEGHRVLYHYIGCTPSSSSLHRFYQRLIQFLINNPQGEFSGRALRSRDCFCFLICVRFVLKLKCSLPDPRLKGLEKKTEQDLSALWSDALKGVTNSREKVVLVIDELAEVGVPKRWCADRSKSHTRIVVVEDLPADPPPPPPEPKPLT